MTPFHERRATPSHTLSSTGRKDNVHPRPSPPYLCSTTGSSRRIQKLVLDCPFMSCGGNQRFDHEIENHCSRFSAYANQRRACQWDPPDISKTTSNLPRSILIPDGASDHDAHDSRPPGPPQATSRSSLPFDDFPVSETCKLRENYPQRARSRSPLQVYSEGGIVESHKVGALPAL